MVPMQEEEEDIIDSEMEEQWQQFRVLHQIGDASWTGLHGSQCGFYGIRGDITSGKLSQFAMENHHF